MDFITVTAAPRLRLIWPLSQPVVIEISGVLEI